LLWGLGGVGLIGWKHLASTKYPRFKKSKRSTL
jgi:hypothetical protein